MMGLGSDKNDNYNGEKISGDLFCPSVTLQIKYKTASIRTVFVNDSEMLAQANNFLIFMSEIVKTS